MNSSEDVIFYFCSTSYGLVGYILHATYFYKPLHRKMNKETEQQSKSKKFAEIQSPCLNDNIPLSLRRRTLKSYMFYDTLPGFNILKTCISAECIKNIPPSCILEFYVSL